MNLYGTKGNDSLVGTSSDDILFGGFGIDTLIGGFGNDTYYANNKTIINENNNSDIDNIVVNAIGLNEFASIFLIPDNVEDLTNGGNIEFTCYGNNLNNYILTLNNKGSVNYFGFTGNDTLSGGIDNDHLWGDEGNDFLLGKSGDDTLYGGQGDDSSAGGDGNDWLFGNGGIDLLKGGQGNDQLSGNEGNDNINGEEGNDYLSGNEGDDYIMGGEGNDYISGDEDNDVLWGGIGDNTLYGGQGNDFIMGGDGNDSIIGGGGNDFISGGLGVNTIFFGGSRSEYIVSKITSDNKELGYTVTSNFEGVDNLIEIEYVYFSKDKLLFNIDSLLSKSNNAPTGNVTISGTPTQNQTLTASNNLADADGLGTIKYQWLSNGVSISGATKSSYVLGSSDIGKTISVKASYIDLLGTDESVTSQSSDAVISTKPSKGNDVLTGTAKNDTLSALAGNDTLIGGLGADKLTGGLGADIFKYISIDDSGVAGKIRDTITDFKHIQGDKIDLSAIDANSALPNDQAFILISAATFSTDATAQLRLDPKTGILYGSTNADNTPEFSILLSGVKTLVAEDLIL